MTFPYGWQRLTRIYTPVDFGLPHKDHLVRRVAAYWRGRITESTTASM
jgi:hypothetical protein